MTLKQQSCGLRATIVCSCLIGLTLWLGVACAATGSAPATPSPRSTVRLHTRTPTPTVIPVTPTPTLSAQILYRQGLSRRVAWDLGTALVRFDAALALFSDLSAGAGSALQHPEPGPGESGQAAAGPDQNLASIYASRAELYRVAGRYDEAAADIQVALALDPDLAEAWRQEALLSRTTGAWDEALDAANALVELRPDDGAAYVLRAQIYAEGFGKPRLALNDYNRAIARAPSLDQVTLMERWHALAALERWHEALRVSQKMFASGSQDPLRYYYQSWAQIQLGRLEDAIYTLLFGLKRYPDYPVALYYALGVAYYERRAWSEAIQALEVALAQSDASQTNTAWRYAGITSADILGWMGLTYMELRQCETGAAIVERAIAESAERGTWGWARERIEACYVALTPTPTPTPTESPVP